MYTFTPKIDISPKHAHHTYTTRRHPVQFRFTIAIDIERTPKPAEPDPQPPNIIDGNYARTEQAPPHYPLGFQPSDVQATTTCRTP